MSIRSVIIIVLGVASGTFAVIGNRMWNARSVALAPPAADVVRVVVAKQPVEIGSIIKAEAVEIKDWPKAMVPESVMTDPAKAVGRVALSALVPGELLLDGKLAPEGVRRGAGALVKPGMRAYSIQATNAASNVAGLILPGDRVDVILSVDASSGERGAGGTSYTLLQNAEILAVNQRLDAPADDRPETKLATVTLLVTQQDASLLGLAQRSGSLSLSLRNPEDELIADQSPISLSSLRGLPANSSGAVSASETGEDQQGFIGDGSGAVGLAEASESADSNTSKSAIRTLRGTQSGSVAITISKN